MTSLTPDALERLFSQPADAMLCIHGVRSTATDTPAGILSMVRVVAHPITEGVLEETAGEDTMLVLDLPMTPTTLALVSGHLSEIMSQTTDIALERLITEDGHGPSPE